MKSKDVSSVKLKTSNYNDGEKRGHKLFILETREMTLLQIIYYQKDKRLWWYAWLRLCLPMPDTGSIPTLGRFHILWGN